MDIKLIYYIAKNGSCRLSVSRKKVRCVDIYRKIIFFHSSFHIIEQGPISVGLWPVILHKVTDFFWLSLQIRRIFWSVKIISQPLPICTPIRKLLFLR